MFGNNEYNAQQWSEVKLFFESSGKAHKKYGEGVFRFSAALTLSVILPRRGWKLVKQNKNYTYLKPPPGENMSPFSITIKIPTEQQAIDIAKDCYQKAESWMGQIGEWPVWYTHKSRMEMVLITNDPVARELHEKSYTEPDVNSYLEIGQFGIWQIRVSKKNEEDFKVYEHILQERKEETNQTEISFMEGREFIVELTKYERNLAARELCINYHGSTCLVCNFDFTRVFGEIGKGFIHVHHIVPVSQQGGEYKVNPVEDLRPLCPNCHAMAHRKNPPYTIDELKNILDATTNSQK